MTFGTAE